LTFNYQQKFLIKNWEILHDVWSFLKNLWKQCQLKLWWLIKYPVLNMGNYSKQFAIMRARTKDDFLTLTVNVSTSPNHMNKCSKFLLSDNVKD
jgi:hypothetical protein